MSIWFQDIPLEKLNSLNKGCMVSHCDISISEIGNDFLKGEMVVSTNIKQPFGIVHGGANCVLAETLGSIAANMTCDPSVQHAVGLSITTNHLKAVRNGIITGIATPCSLGRSVQVWDIKTYNSKSELTSTTLLTMKILDKLNS